MISVMGNDVAVPNKFGLRDQRPREGEDGTAGLRVALPGTCPYCFRYSWFLDGVLERCI